MSINFDKYRNNVGSLEGQSNDLMSNNYVELKSSDLLEAEFRAHYLGGHKAIPIQKPMDIKILVFPDRLELTNVQLTIPYSSMRNIENMDKEQISTLRVVAIGVIFWPLLLVGRLWKKEKLYTVLEFDDGNDNQTIILDFGDHIEEMQPLIYRKMIKARTKK